MNLKGDRLNLRQIIRALCNRIIREREELTTLDQAVGDGDFGVNLERGANAVLCVVNRPDESEKTDRLLMEIGKTLNAAGCGTAGTLISFGVMAGATRCQNLTTFLEAALTRIQAAGKTQVGDKTMVDALLPAVEALKKGGPGRRCQCRPKRRARHPRNDRHERSFPLQPIPSLGRSRPRGLSYRSTL